ncbi:unnamed protein product [Angiostrongylus costaricensis]|uniref:Delta(24)-sterol reductase n=1 Tax=Angiostrongylus costaricensis TaxID=334426 RepID=A0A158PDU8_ANGCS|nr:unnamed protein product [Angiostrongylus costaricensis]
MGVHLLTLVKRLLIWFLLRLQWIVILCVVLPFNFICEQFLINKKRLVFAIGTAKRAHGRKVLAIQRQVREWATNGKSTIMCPVENGQWRSHQIPKGITPIYIGNLVHILEVNKEALSVRVEPMVTMEDLSRTLIPLGYCVPLVPAIKGLTVQEAINGGGVGTSGRKYGMFQHICLSYELVMPDGNVVTASKERNGNAEMQALYYGVPWSRGALGILVAVTLRMIPIKPFVKLMYIPVNSFEEMQSRLIKECMCRENEFVEGIQFSNSLGVVLHGKFCEGPLRSEKASVNEIGRWYKPSFYTHLQNIASSITEHAELVPLQDFHNRHSRSLFWEVEDLISFGKCFLFQCLVGRVVPSSIQLLETFTPNMAKSWSLTHVHEDLIVPLEHLKEAMDFCDKEFKIYPLWMCPYNQPSCPGIFRQRSGRNVLFVSVGVHGNVRRDRFDPKDSIKRLEEFVISVKGVKMVHGDMRMSRAEFWQMFDSSLYEWIRVKYNCKEAFLDVYDKICMSING